MSDKKKPVIILIAEDDDDDFLLMQEAFAESRILNRLFRVEDGEKLLDYLSRRGRFSDPEEAPRPTIILLDLNMPRKDGREALREIKASPDFHDIPVVVLTTSNADEDIINAYDLGVNSFIKKPVGFKELLELMKIFNKYWFEIVELPNSVRRK